MAQSIYKSPSEFSFKATDWQAWSVAWTRYMRLAEIHKQNDEHQIDALVYHMGTDKAEKVMGTFKYGKKAIVNPEYAEDNSKPPTLEADESDKCYAEVLSKFQNHYVPKVNVVNESQNYNKRKQNTTESIDDFIIA